MIVVGREGPRPGGRSSRVQASVHKAARELLATMDRDDVTVPAIAERAGTTPSTIYRRWGGLKELLADIAAERLQPDVEPADTGDPRADLLVWAEQYADEMSSLAGRTMIRDVLGVQDRASAVQCCDYTVQQIGIIAERARLRGQPFPSVDAILESVVAPVIYGILFREVPDAERVGALVARVFVTAGRPGCPSAP